MQTNEELKKSVKPRRTKFSPKEGRKLYEYTKEAVRHAIQIVRRRGGR